MAKLDIEEKFKKDISKEVANLKEFLISQGKEIVKLKQENKVTISNRWYYFFSVSFRPWEKEASEDLKEVFLPI